MICTRMTSLYGIQPSSVCFFNAKQWLWDQTYKSLLVPALFCDFWMQNSDFCTGITSHYVSQPSSVVFACKTAHFGPELQVSMGPRPHLWFWAHITACLAQESKDYIGSSTHLWFCACKTWTLGLELQDPVGQRPHLLFLHAKLRLLDQNNKSLWVTDMTCHFVHAKQCD